MTGAAGSHAPDVVFVDAKTGSTVRPPVGFVSRAEARAAVAGACVAAAVGIGAAIGAVAL